MDESCSGGSISLTLRSLKSYTMSSDLKATIGPASVRTWSRALLQSNVKLLPVSIPSRVVYKLAHFFTFDCGALV